MGPHYPRPDEVPGVWRGCQAMDHVREVVLMPLLR